jgi:Uma2 family endonuclease
MTATISIEQPAVVPIQKPKKQMTLDIFRRLYENKDDDWKYKYEWNNGLLEKTSRTMNKNQQAIVRRLLRLFLTTNAHKNMSELLAEVEMFMPKNNRTRKPNMVLMTDKQIIDAEKDIDFVGDFVIEIVSKTDKAEDIYEKIKEYFDNGVKAVWEIYPKSQKVEVYTSANNMQFCRGNALCSAAPVLPDFNITANELFGL